MLLFVGCTKLCGKGKGRLTSCQPLSKLYIHGVTCCIWRIRCLGGRQVPGDCAALCPLAQACSGVPSPGVLGQAPQPHITVMGWAPMVPAG